MKSKIFFFLIFIMLRIPISYAQQVYQRLHGITESQYSIKAELQLVYTYSVKTTGEQAFSQTGTLHFNSPSFLHFNKNDLLFFQVEPNEFLYNPLIVDASCCFSDSEGNNEEVAGYSSITEHVTTIEDGANSEINLKGEQQSSVKITFMLYDFANKVKSGGKDFQFRLEFSHEDCPNCEQKDVSGYIQYENMKITDNLRLVGGIFSSIRFNEYLVQAKIDNDMATKDDRTKWTFEDTFTDNYYKDMPRINADSLIDFLLNPKGVIEFPISGFLNSPDGTEKMTYKGSLRLYGDKIYKFWSGE